MSEHRSPSEPQESSQARRIEAEILAQAAARGPDKSICPSEVARALSAEWRPLMGPVRQGAMQLARDGRIDILRKGRAIPPDAVRGVVRLRLRGAS